MITIDDLQLVGWLKKAKGLKGELKVSFEAFFITYLESEGVPDYLFLKKKEELIPCFIEQLDIQTADIAYIKFEDIEDKKTAVAYQHAELFIKKDMFTKAGIAITEETEEYWWDFLLGYELIMQENQSLGKIDDIIYLPEHELAQVIYQGKEVLLPLHEDFIAKVDEEKNIIYMDLPNGLLDLD